jgi:non-heme chloroperoxidase
VRIAKCADETPIFYRDWGKGQPVVFSHGWPVNSDLWESQMFYLAKRGYRVIAFDRRGHGRSGQPWDGYSNDSFADDLRTLIETLGLREATLVGHSMGGGEIARYAGLYGTAHLARMIFVSAVPPLMLQTKENPAGLPMSVFDNFRKELAQNRAQFYWDLSIPYFGHNRASERLGVGRRRQFVRLALQSSIKASFECIRVFSEDDFTDDLKQIDVPTLFLHGEDDQIVPIQNTSVLGADIVKNASLRIITNGPHGVPVTHANVVNQELLSFLQTT